MGEATGDKAKRDDKAKDAAPVRADEATTKAADGDDKLGALAKSDATVTTTADDDRTLNDYLTSVQHSFHWFNESAQRGLERLRGDLKKEDEPDWSSQIIGAVLEVGLGAGAAAAGVRIAQALGPGGAEVGAEFVKVLFEGGVNAGITAGRAKLAGGKADHVIDPFIDSQKEGVEATQMMNQKQFIKVERHKVKTVAEAKDLDDACSRENLKAAAEDQYAATRDAWVSYLAQTTFGAIAERGGAVQKDSVNVGKTTTNMSSAETRRRTNKSAPGFVPSTAPDLAGALRGDAPGVLEVLAELPAIEGDRMSGRPSVELAVLNGVNDTIRKQYEGTPLSAMNIPRQVVAKVDGAPNFTLSFNEKGEHNYLKTKERTWLAARATVGHPENATKDEWSRSEEGVKLLLRDLAPSPIKKELW
ncbi:MAG: hypothetical protein M3680_11125 [Myxococcota bacterium]|nr:hypothetical protein [Myxococcota bacterium]